MSHNKLQYTMITTTNMKQYDTTYNDIQQKGATICYNLQYCTIHNEQKIE